MPLSESRSESGLCTLAPESAQAKRRRVLAGVVSKAFESKFGSAGPHAVALRVADFLNKKERAPLISVTLTLREGEFEPLIIIRPVREKHLCILRARGFLDIYAYKYVSHVPPGYRVWDAEYVGKWVWREKSDQKARHRAAAVGDDGFAALKSELNAA